MAIASRRLNDEQLSVTRLEIDDPLAVPNLSRARPPADLTPEIVGEYHLPTEGPPIWCCHCQGHRHWNGFVITNSTGAQYLIGSACGPNHYALTFTYARNQHKALTKRKGILDRIQRICAVAEATKQASHNLLHSEPLQLIDQKRTELKRASENAFSLLTTYVQNGSPLTEMVSVRDLDAERRRDERLPEGKSGPPIYVQEPASLGVVAGAGLLRQKGDCRDRLIALQRAIDAVWSARARGTDGQSLQTLTKVLRAAEESWTLAQAAIVEAEAAPAFFTTENLSRLQRWSAAHRHFDLQGEGTSLRVSHDSRSTTVAPLPTITLGRIPALNSGG